MKAHFFQNFGCNNSIQLLLPTIPTLALLIPIIESKAVVPAIELGLTFQE